MGFVNEKIPPADYAKFGLGVIDDKYLATSSGSTTWTFDREREIYLRRTQSWRDWRPGIVGWNFFWNGHLFDFESKVLVTRGARNGPVWQHRKLFGFVVPQRLLVESESIKHDLVDAFLACKEADIASTSTSFDLQLDITDEKAPE